MNELFVNVFIQYSSVLLELKGVKVIRSYREYFQLIRDFLRINDTFRLFYMISLLFARVINLIIVIVIVNNFCIVMVRIYNFVENKGIFQQNMASAAEGSGAGGCDRCSSRE